MTQKKYIFRAESLRYETHSPGWKEKIRIYLAILIAGAGIALTASFLHISPAEKKLKSENADMKTEYSSLSGEVDRLRSRLSEIEKRDDLLYRSVLGVSPVDTTIRMAGMGGQGRTFSYHETVKETREGIEKLRSRLKVEEKSLIKIRELAGKNQDRMLHLPAIMPVSNEDLSYTGSAFGMRYHPILKIRRMHEGIDFISPAGSPVYATADGIVAEARVSGTFGNVIEIDHGYGYRSLYAHLKEFSVKKGQVIKRGDTIGLVGNTGLSAGTHLHYEIHQNGRETDPVHYFFNDLSSKEYEEIIQIANSYDASLD